MEKRRTEKIEKIKNGGAERGTASPLGQGEEMRASIEAEGE